VRVAHPFFLSSRAQVFNAYIKNNQLEYVDELGMPIAEAPPPALPYEDPVHAIKGLEWRLYAAFSFSFS